MDRDRAKQLWITSLKEELNEADKSWLQTYFKQHPNEEADFKKSEEIWLELGELSAVVPSNQMDAKFYQFLQEEKKLQPTSSGKTSQFAMLEWLTRFHWAYVIVLLLGIGIGYYLQAFRSNSEINELVSDVKSMKQMMALTLMNQPMAQDRIRAVGLVEDLQTTDDKVMNALIKTLNHDPSVNVRLKVIETMRELHINEQFRSELVTSISRQEHPLIQVALADLMVQMQEKSSIDELKKLLDNEKTNPLVKEKINETLEVLI